jgi:hypothetical protein
LKGNLSPLFLKKKNFWPNKRIRKKSLYQIILQLVASQMSSNVINQME